MRAGEGGCGMGRRAMGVGGGTGCGWCGDADTDEMGWDRNGGGAVQDDSILREKVRNLTVQVNNSSSSVKNPV